MNGRRVNFQHFQIVRAIEFVMDNACRLQDTITGVEQTFSLAFVYEFNPAFQYVEHLKVAQVLMQTSRVQVMYAAGILLDADDMGPELSMGGLFNAKVAIFHKAA